MHQNNITSPDKPSSYLPAVLTWGEGEGTQVVLVKDVPLQKTK